MSRKKTDELHVIYMSFKFIKKTPVLHISYTIILSQYRKTLGSVILLVSKEKVLKKDFVFFSFLRLLKKGFYNSSLYCIVYMFISFKK